MKLIPNQARCTEWGALSRGSERTLTLRPPSTRVRAGRAVPNANESASDRVVVTRHGRIAHVELNRPEKKNGLYLAMFEAIVAAGESLLDDKSLRAVVLSGRGGCFCSGLDVQSFMANADVSIPKLLDNRVGPANLAQRVAWIWREIRVPVIAAIEGVAFGGGLQIAAGADIRIAAPTARLSIMEAKVGLIPDMGLTKTLAGTVRPDVLKELVWTARVVEAAEAKALGLVTSVHDDPSAAAFALAQTIASHNPDAIQSAKHLLDVTGAQSVADAFALESHLQRPILGSANQLEAIMAKMELRDGEFTDPTT